MVEVLKDTGARTARVKSTVAAEVREADRATAARSLRTASVRARRRPGVASSMSGIDASRTAEERGWLL